MAPSVQRRKVWLTPTTRVVFSNTAKTRNPLKFAEVPQTCQQISDCEHVWEILQFNNFFSDCRYVPWLRRYSPTKLCDGAQMAIFCVQYFQRATCSTFQTCILNSHQGHTMCGSMVDIQCADAEIRRGQKKKDR